ncbi:Stealth CR1 domain-containing protein [Bartonella tamiae]|uniref:Stealth protein CR2 conserved region 2 domain-containing protein n=1 Tax=Bartonella tamiae Th239 TaxID=1094558 RepID=J1JXM8_9HYPH|nr:Stealth CR1 domain-containing protein [Bartonella tamiae]EJF89385.1 hypothetical protein ME5_01936 [Bartonella tamiae Th239]EJF92750.1 hypothetical protein MEG_01920 [Bartonella tamiae Th307]
MDIDYVITWVDGGDPNHIAARQHYKALGKKTHYESFSSERYIDNGEIYYHLASLLKYAPFIRRVFLVTDHQISLYLEDFFNDKLCDRSFIQVISHDEVFDGLPVIRPSFNARAIESTLWRIKDLSEYFIYANDDFFLNASIEKEIFFDHARPVLSGKWQKSETKRFKYRCKKFMEHISPYRYVRPNHALSQSKEAFLAGVEGDYFNVHHMPHPLRRSLLKKYFDDHPDLLNKQVSYRYRDIEQFNLVALANNLEILNDHAKIEKIHDFAYVDYVKPKQIDTALNMIKNDCATFGCIQGFECFEVDTRKKIHRILIEKFRKQLPQSVISMVESKLNL